MKHFLITIACLHFGYFSISQQLVEEKLTSSSFSLKNVVICVDPNDDELVKVAANHLQQDIKAVTGIEPRIVSDPLKDVCIIIGSLSKSSLIKNCIVKKEITNNAIKNKWESFEITTLKNKIIIAGADRRGTAYGVFELSKQMGVSPWYWWADVPVKKKKEIFIKKNTSLTDAPKVKYRGIFINDEAPALSNWSKEKFGGFNHKFYEKVFEIILRLKGNYLWPAMWGNAFYYDDSLNIKTADEYGIVIGTSHHEPLMRAHEEWKYFGKGRKWNYDSTEAGLKEFWRGGMERAWNEKIVSVGMRGDGDEPMSRETATALLERIVKDQREIIADVTGKPASETPQLWALYKEVQDYYDKGMRVPDDVTLLLCDDNWGNIRKLPKADAKPRKGGYGIYYHFDYVGGPRNYKWLNTNPLPRIWEQMHLAWEYDVKNIWIVNVGDIKPMEFPISFFLDYAWNPDKINADDLQKYSQQWVADNFGKQYANEIADIIAKYAKYNGRKKPEMLDDKTYSFNYQEWPTVVKDYNALLKQAEEINTKLPTDYRDAYFQLVLHPVKACANLNEMYYNVALNKEGYSNKWEETNAYADKVKELYQNDSLITLAYHQLNNDKWNHMMSQKHIGYRIWQEPRQQTMPVVKYLPADSVQALFDTAVAFRKATYPSNNNYNIFYEEDGYVSIGADHYSKAMNSNGITWKILPDHGRTGSAITTFPIIAQQQKPFGISPHLEYDFYTYSKDSLTTYLYFSPTYNFHDTDEGMRFGISIDNETPQIISVNKESKGNEGGIMYNWVANNIIIKNSKHSINRPGKHTLKYWMVDSGIVLQKLVIDLSGLKETYLGPPETIVERKKPK